MKILQFVDFFVCVFSAVCPASPGFLYQKDIFCVWVSPFKDVLELGRKAFEHTVRILSFKFFFSLQVECRVGISVI